MQTDPEIKDLISKYFTFSRREYKAAIALFILSSFIWLFSDIKNYLIPPKFNNAELLQKAAELDAVASSIEDSYAQDKNWDRNKSENPKESPLPDYFMFNPNTTSATDLSRLGFSKKQIHIIENYISKVGQIKSKDDFRKIYGISETQFAALDPFIDLPEARPSNTNSTSERKSKKLALSKIELNTADSNDFDRLPGIGMGYARRIIKYRNALGGFVNISQLLEVYGFRQSLLDSISPFLNLDLSKIILLNINTAELEELRKHPYIRYKFANAIVNYRQQHGRYANIEDIKNVVLMTDELFDKIKSYITVD